MTGSRLAIEQDRPGVRDRAEAFGLRPPYKLEPYSKRNWGHPLHSLSSYQGKLKPGVAHWLVREFTSPGDVVIDPLGGVGTIAIEACLQGRLGVTNDLSPFAYTIATGKLRAPTPESISRALAALDAAIAGVELLDDDMVSASFGLNGSVADYYHPLTLVEILRARRYFGSLSAATDADLFVKACLLHVLHGNRPYALSRTSHPITPFHPTGAFIYKSVAAHVRARAEKMLASPLPHTFVGGISVNQDYAALRSLDLPRADCIITSPPFLGMRFDRPNWLRMWFCGWEAADFHTTSLAFLERQQARDLAVYDTFFEKCDDLLEPGGLVVIHMGGSDQHNMVQVLTELLARRFRVLEVVEEDVTRVERHGIRDKGLTTSHNFIFAQKL
jgi:hypothetical protein